jgi:ketosteroid isomerase-like protein
MADFKKEQPAGPPAGSPSLPDDDFLLNPSAEEFFKRFQSEMRRPQPSPDAIAAMQRLAAESVADAAPGSTDASADDFPVCMTCGYKNRPNSRFCGMCGMPVEAKAVGTEEPVPGGPAVQNGPHHYHHHYHHHYFSSSPDFQLGGGRAVVPDAAPREPARFRAPGTPQVVSRAEAAVRQVTQDWAVACNNRQLDDLVSIYATDALVMRPNHPAIRGAPAIREFFFSALDAGLGEVELDILRVDVIGDVAYEAGRCKMLVPTAIGKRREERGKYLMILSRQSNAEWRIVADCWSSDLSLASSEADAGKPTAPANPAARPPAPRKP